MSIPRIKPVNASKINETWAMDFVSDNLYDGRRFKALTIIDIFSRECLDIYDDQSIKGIDVVSVLEKLKLNRKLPEII